MEDTRTEAIIARGIRVSVKSILIIAVTATLAGMAASSFGGGSYILAAVYSLGFLCLLVIQTVFTDGWASAFLSSSVYAAVLSGLTYIARPDMSFSVIGAAFLASLIFFLIGQIAGRGVMDNSLKINFSAVTKAVISKAFTGLALFLALFYGFSASPAETVVSYFSKTTARASATVLKYYLPDLSVDMKAGDFFRALAENEARSVIPNFASLPEKLREDAVKKLSNESVKQVESSFKIAINADLPVKSQIEETVASKGSIILKAFDQFYVSSFVAIIVFITLLAASPLVSAAAVIIGIVIYEALIVFRFAKRTYEPRDKEIVSL